MKRSARYLALLTATFALCAAHSAAHAQWTVDYTVRYEAAGQQTGKPGEPRGPDTLVSEKITWRVQQEVRGTLNYTQKVRGAVASNMPDKNNEQRYDSWISRSGRAGNPASLKLDAEEVTDSAVQARQGRWRRRGRHQPRARWQVRPRRARAHARRHCRRRPRRGAAE